VSLEGKSVVVTGGAAGIGRYIARGCAERGAHVTIGDVDDGMLDAAEQELSAFGNGVRAIHCDVRVEEDAQRLIDTAAEAFGTVDYLVNNAGIAPQTKWKPRWPYFRDMDASLWNLVMDTNIHGLFLCSKAALVHMERQRSGHIVNVHSWQAGEAFTTAALYVMSKKAALIFTRYLAEQERPYNICVMSIVPGGPFATESAPEELRATWFGPEIAGDRYFQAADAPMCLSGRLLSVSDGHLVPIDYNFAAENMPVPSEPAADSVP
jgi:NAD(P)-dependent dehydrogenase (short-subunit alcohol dehydrogenase family)